MRDGEAFGKQMVVIIRDYVEGQLAPRERRIAELERRTGAEGNSTKDFPPDWVR